MEKHFDKNELDYFLKLLSTAKDETSIESYIYIKNMLNSIEFPIPITIYPVGKEFIRSRIHKENEGLFDTVDQLSYRMDIGNIKTFGRANEPGQSVFYCSDNYNLSLAETSQILREQIEEEFECMTTGTWISTEELKVVSLLTNENIKGQHAEIDESSKSFENIISMQNDESAFVFKNLYQFLSKEFSQIARGNSNHYKITSAFTNYIFDSVKVADGILYPSAIYPTEGFNFAFKPKIVDNKMKFHVAEWRKNQTYCNKKYIQVEKIESEINETNSNIIKWLY